MSAESLLADLESRGVRVTERSGNLAVRPAGAVTPADLAVLRQRKAEVLAFLRSRSLGVDWTTVSLYRLDRILEVAVPWADMPLVLAPGCRVARELRAQDPKPGRVLCVCEAIDLLLSGVTPEDARKVAEAKLGFSGSVVGVRPAKAKAL